MARILFWLLSLTRLFYGLHLFRWSSDIFLVMSVLWSGGEVLLVTGAHHLMLVSLVFPIEHFLTIGAGERLSLGCASSYASSMHLCAYTKSHIGYSNALQPYAPTAYVAAWFSSPWTPSHIHHNCELPSAKYQNIPLWSNTLIRKFALVMPLIWYFFLYLFLFFTKHD